MSRATEIAAFLGIPVADAEARLSKGFGYQHQRVNDDFRRCNPRTDEELLNWYRTTTEYIFELSAYHDDPGFNYSGMCSGIIERLKNEGSRRVLCLGDGIGDLTLDCRRAGLDAVYHDLDGSRTAAFAEWRYKQHTGDDLNYVVTGGWEPEIIAENSYAPFDAVISLDYMEHLTRVDLWCHAVFRALRPGGLFMASNAFDCGSGPDGSIPCHLTINDKYAHAAPHTAGRALWDHLLIEELGFVQLGPNWYQKPA
jgi:SAM-dependent methyltransferase